MDNNGSREARRRRRGAVNVEPRITCDIFGRAKVIRGFAAQRLAFERVTPEPLFRATRPETQESARASIANLSFARLRAPLPGCPMQPHKEAHSS